MNQFRKFTSVIPMKDKTVALTDGRTGFANTVEDKLAMAKKAKSRALYVAWPGAFETHVFKATGKDVVNALTEPTPLAVGDLVRLTKLYGGGPKVGDIGVVRVVRPVSTGSPGVEWGGLKTGHDLSGVLKGLRAKSGWWTPESHIERA